MMKNVFLGFVLGALVVMLALVVTGKLVWASRRDDTAAWPDARQRALREAHELHKPTVLELADQQLLCVPTSKMRGDNISVDHVFAVLEDGKLKQVTLTKDD